MFSATFKRYITIGISVYLFELSIILIAQRIGFGPVAAVAISFWLGLLLSFGLQKLITFGDKRLSHGVLVPQLLAFSGLVLFNFGFTILVTKLCANNIPAVATRTIALGITTIWNFYLYKTRIFKSNDNPVY